MVTGTVTHAGGYETGVTVNGIVADVYGDRFVANHVPLQGGSNVITASGTNASGGTSTASVTVNAVTTGNYIRLTADAESGASPFVTTLRVGGTLSIGASTLTATGPAQPGIVALGANQYQVNMSAEGIYYFTVSVTGPGNKLYQDIIAIEVMNLAAPGVLALPNGFALAPASLTVSSISGRASVGANGGFTASEPAGGGPATVYLTDPSGKIVLIGHVDTNNPSFNEVSAMSTAEELLFLSTGATTLPQSEWANVYRLLAAAPETATLAGVISARMAVSPTAVGDQDPAIITAVNAATASLLSVPAASVASRSLRGDGARATIMVAQGTTSSAIVSVQTTPSATTPDPEYGLVVAASEDNTGIVITNSARINRYYYVYRTGYVPADGKVADPATAVSPWVLVKEGFLPAVNGSTGVVNTFIDYFTGKGTWKAEKSGTIPLPPTPSNAKANTYQVFVVGAGTNIISTPADLLANGDSAIVVNMQKSMAIYQGMKEIVWPILTKVLPANASTSQIWSDPSKVVNVANQFFKEVGTAGAAYSTQLLNGGDLWPSTMIFFKASVANPQFRDAVYHLVGSFLWAGAEVVPAAQAPLVVFDQFASKLFAIIKPIDAVLTAGDVGGIFYQVLNSNTFNIWDVRAAAPTLILVPPTSNIPSPDQSATFSVTVSGYASSSLTYQWGPATYGKFTGCGKTKQDVLTCVGNQVATYSLTGTTLPTTSDPFDVEVFDPHGLSLGKIHGTVTFDEVAIGTIYLQIKNMTFDTSHLINGTGARLIPEVFAGFLVTDPNNVLLHSSHSMGGPSYDTININYLNFGTGYYVGQVIDLSSAANIHQINLQLGNTTGPYADMWNKSGTLTVTSYGYDPSYDGYGYYFNFTASVHFANSTGTNKLDAVMNGSMANLSAR